MTGRPTQIWTVVVVDLRRLLRDRTALFFIAVLPVVVIVAIGSFVPDSDVELSIRLVDEDRSAASETLVSTLAARPGLMVDQESERRSALRDLRIGRASAVVVVPEGFGVELSAGRAEVEVALDDASASAPLVRAALDEVLGAERIASVLRRQLEQAGVAPGLAERRAEQTASSLVRGAVEVRMEGTDRQDATFAFVTAGQMILFMFVNSLAAGAALIEMRRMGVSGRLLAGPVDAGDLVSGVAVARVLVAMLLAGMLAVLAVAIYGVDWGDPAVLVTVVTLFALIAAGASTLIGAVLDAPDAATSVGIPVGLAMAALGGCMFPLWLAPEPLQVAAKVLTPHAWAVEALVESSSSGDGLVELRANVAVLSAWAVGLLVLGRVLARRRLRTA